MPWTAVRTAAVLILPAAGMTGISILSACVTAAAVSRISGHRFTAESAVPAAAAAIIPVSVGISIHTHSPLFLILFCVHFILCTLPKIVPLFSRKQKKREDLHPLNKKERGFTSSLGFFILPDLLLLFLPVFFPEFP